LLSLVVLAVMKMTGIERDSSSACRCWQTSIPSMSGIIRSRRIRSGFPRLTESRHSVPFLAVAVWIPRLSRPLLRSWMLIGWSSTISTVGAGMVALLSESSQRGCRDWQVETP